MNKVKVTTSGKIVDTSPDLETAEDVAAWIANYKDGHPEWGVEGDKFEVVSPIPEPVPKEIQAEYVQADQNLMWLAEHGMLHMVALLLASLRRETEFQESH